MDSLDKIFKAYDIRGKYPDEVNEELAYKIGRATAQFLNWEIQSQSFKLRKSKLKSLIIGRDNRLSSENLFKVLSEGIRDEGVDVIDIGLTTTPMLYFTVAKFGLKGGLMITASHNPPEYNGFKIVRKEAMPLGQSSGLEKIKRLVKKVKDNPTAKRGELKKKEVLKDYIENILNFAHINNIKPFKIIADTANGTAGLIVPELSRHLSVNLISIFANLDGSFPNHAPNPSNPENTKTLQEKVLSEKADLGIAFDGDGDRILFIDEKGQRIDPNFIFALLIVNLFHNKGEILYDIIASQVVREEIQETGNIPICSKVGHTFVKEKMKKEKIIFGAESSGHYYFKENYFIESPFIVLLKVLEILSKNPQPLSGLIKPFQKYYLERINLKSSRSQTSKIMKKIEKKYKKTAKISHLDGLLIEFKDWWFNLRPSQTEPYIRLTIEARTKELLEKKKKELRQLVGLN